MTLESLFGGRVRAATLEALAMTSEPLSAYRVAKAAEAQPIQVLSILKALQPEVVLRTDRGWVLVNDPIRRFFRNRVAKQEAERRQEKDELILRLKQERRPVRGRD